jgi:hypothetical protein
MQDYSPRTARGIFGETGGTQGPDSIIAVKVRGIPVRLAGGPIDRKDISFKKAESDFLSREILDFLSSWRNVLRRNLC